MEKMERDFKGIWIPASLWLDPELSAIEVVLLAEIDSLDKGKGCFASNEYLSKFLRGRVSPKRVANMITDLRKKGYLIDRSFDGRNRYISVPENVKAAFPDSGGQTSQIREHSNTVSNTNTKNTYSPSTKDEASTDKQFTQTNDGDLIPFPLERKSFSETASPQHRKCTYCNVGQDQVDWGFEWDHFIPRSAGGPDDESNRVWACHTCNQIKQHRLFDTIDEARSFIHRTLWLKDRSRYEIPRQVCFGGKPPQEYSPKVFNAELSASIQKILEDLNSLSGKRFSLKSEGTKRLIKARLAEGYTIDDFLKVHRNKKTWVNDPEMDKYVRPQTLYAANHFESYLNEKPPVVPGHEPWRYGI